MHDPAGMADTAEEALAGRVSELPSEFSGGWTSAVGDARKFGFRSRTAISPWTFARSAASDPQTRSRNALRSPVGVSSASLRIRSMGISLIMPKSSQSARADRFTRRTVPHNCDTRINKKRYGDGPGGARVGRRRCLPVVELGTPL